MPCLSLGRLLNPSSGMQEDTGAAAERLLIAIKSNNEALVCELIQKYSRNEGAKGKESPLFCQDRDGWTPLMWAASKGAARIVLMCLEAGVAEVNHASLRAKPGSCRQSTALHECAARCGEEASGAGAWNYTETARLLLDAGADPFLENGKGMTAVDYAQKWGNVAMKNLLQEKAAFRGYLRMLSPAKLFGAQRWGARYCVVVPRRAAKGAQEGGKEVEASYWLVTYKKEDACQPLSTVPLVDASVALLYESDARDSAEKSLLILNREGVANSHNTVFVSATSDESCQVQVQAPMDTPSQKGSQVLAQFAQAVNSSRGGAPLDQTPAPLPLFVGGSASKRGQARLIRSAPHSPPPGAVAASQSAPIPAESGTATFAHASQVSGSRAASPSPQHRVQELGSSPRRSPDLAEVGGGGPEKAGGELGLQTAVRTASCSSGTRMSAQERRRRKAEAWLMSQHIEDDEIKPPMPNNPVLPGVARRNRDSVSIEAQSISPRAAAPSGMEQGSLRDGPFDALCPGNLRQLEEDSASDFGGRPQLSGHAPPSLASIPFPPQGIASPSLCRTETRSQEAEMARSAGLRGASHGLRRVKAGDQHQPLGRGVGSENAVSRHSFISEPGAAIYASIAANADARRDAGPRSVTGGRSLIQAAPSHSQGNRSQGWLQLQADPSLAAKAEIQNHMQQSDSRETLEGRRAEAKRRVQKYLDSRTGCFDRVPSIQSTIPESFLDTGGESILSMTSTDWRQKFTRNSNKVPLRKAVLDDASLFGDEESLLQTNIFQEAINSIPNINAAMQHDGRRHMRQQFLFDLIRCPLTKQLYHEPVYASDGFTYEKAAFIEHCKTDRTSPITKEPLQDLRLCPNLSVVKAVQAYLEVSKSGRGKP